MKWFKFYGTEYLADQKIEALTAEERSCWLTLLCYASVIGDNSNDNANDNGVIKHLTEERLMFRSGLDPQDPCWDRTVGVLGKLEMLEMIQIDNEEITIKNWRKRQDSNLTGYERVKRYREKKRNDNAKITSEESRVEKRRNNNRGVRFAPPSVEEVSSYCSERDNHVDAQVFVDFYESKGWMIGKNKMKDWKAAVRTWEKHQKESSKKAYYQGREMRWAQGKWWVVPPDGGQWLEFAGKESEIEYANSK